MLIEFRGKIYEISPFVLYFLIAVVGILVLGLLSYGLYGLSTFFYSSPSSGILAHPSALGSSDQTLPFDATDSSFVSSVSQFPQEVQQVLATHDPSHLNAELVCSFEGKGRVASRIGDGFDCRKTENLKMFVIHNIHYHCCVVP
ncbi:MAG: hypothetical protein QW594_03650 [Candidatus Woesearchaeota archaeon]